MKNVERLAKKFLAGNYPVMIEETPLGDSMGTIRMDIVGFIVNKRLYRLTPVSKIYWAIWNQAMKRGWSGSHWDSPFTFGSCNNASDFEHNEAWNPSPKVTNYI